MNMLFAIDAQKSYEIPRPLLEGDARHILSYGDNLSRNYNPQQGDGDAEGKNSRAL